MMPLKQPTATLGSYKTIKYQRFEGLNIAKNRSISLVTINAQI